MPIVTGTRTHLPHAWLEPEHALVAALMRQALADRDARSAVVRHDARAWFARRGHVFWLNLVGLPESALDRELKEA